MLGSGEALLCHLAICLKVAYSDKVHGWLRRYPNDAWEVLLGYDQEKMVGERAGAGLLPDIQAVDKAQCTPADAM